MSPTNNMKLAAELAFLDQLPPVVVHLEPLALAAVTKLLAGVVDSPAWRGCPEDVREDVAAFIDGAVQYYRKLECHALVAELVAR